MTAAAVMDFVAAAVVLGFVAVEAAGVVVITVERVGTWRGTVGAR